MRSGRRHTQPHLPRGAEWVATPLRLSTRAEMIDLALRPADPGENLAHEL